MKSVPQVNELLEVKKRMKATGIVRRIDDLGRVVIPKEIRRTLRIREGDPLEIFIDNDGGVIFKKYSPLNQLENYAKLYADSLYKTTGYPVIIADRDYLVSGVGINIKDPSGLKVSTQLDLILEQKKVFIAKENDTKTFLPTDSLDHPVAAAAAIVLDGEVVGSVILLENKGLGAVTEVHGKILEMTAMVLGDLLKG